jgi:hypothetical protein
MKEISEELDGGAENSMKRLRTETETKQNKARNIKEK